MKLSLARRIDLSVFFLITVAFAALLALVGYFFSSTFYELRYSEIKKTIDLNIEKINHDAQKLERKVKELAFIGEKAHAQQHQNFPKVETWLQQELIHAFERCPESVGGGIWYEPYQFNPAQKHYGPYAFYQDESVLFTWDLNTPEYDYFNWDWYTTALPEGWDRSDRRPRDVYWTTPYHDGAATGALMITVDGFMTDGDGKIIGITTADWDLSAMLQMLESTKATPFSESFLVHADSGLILSYTMKPELVMSDARKLAWFESISGARQGHFEFVENLEMDGDGYTLFATRTQNDMLYGMLVPHNDIVEPLIETFVVGLVCALGFAIAVIFFINQNQNLASSVRRFEEHSKILAEKNEKIERALKELKETQDQLVEREKMASLGGLVAGVAHEINTPIGVAITSSSIINEITTQILQNMGEGKLKRAQLESSVNRALEAGRIIQGNLERAATLIQSFKQVAVDQSTDEIREFNLCDYLGEVVFSLKHELVRRGVQAQVLCSSEIIVRTSAGGLSQVVTNLIMNAMIHGLEDKVDGQITIQATREENNQIRLLFEDNGRGIPEKNLPKIFEPFFTTKRNRGGTGLGLHIIYNIVTQQLYGTIHCESQVEHYTRMIIQFPACIDDKAKNALADSSTTPTSAPQQT